MAVYFHSCGKEIDVQIHWAGTHYVSRFLDMDSGCELNHCVCGAPLYAALCGGTLAEPRPQERHLNQP